MKWYSICFSLTLFLTGCTSKHTTFDNKIQGINHVVIIYMENHSFDNLWGDFDGANGLKSAKERNITQLNESDSPYQFLPEIPRNKDFPSNLPNSYFNIDQYVSSDKEIPSPTHAFYPEMRQINDGQMNRFASNNVTKGLAMGYYETKKLPLYPLAKEFTLCDNFFHSGFGNSYFNHIFLIAARPAEFPNSSREMLTEVDSLGHVTKGGLITPDGYVIGTMFTKNGPYPPKVDTARLLPPQTFPTIGDRLSEKEVSWAWFSAGWDSAIAGIHSNGFSYHHQPFAYFKNYGPETEGRRIHLKDEKDFFKETKEGRLPNVSFIKPNRFFNEHPGSSTIIRGEEKALEYVNAIRNSPNWETSLIILTYDENGGFWDHVAPPRIDRWGPGTRVPAILISPFVKRGFVDHMQYETVSILSFIERRWDIKPLGSRDSLANPLENAFDLTR